jgi:hypothetical protein
MTEAELDDLLVRYADGTLDTERLAQLEAELARSGIARARLRDLAEQAFAIGEVARCREARSPQRRVWSFLRLRPRGAGVPFSLVSRWRPCCSRSSPLCRRIQRELYWK